MWGLLYNPLKQRGGSLSVQRAALNPQTEDQTFTRKLLQHALPTQPLTTASTPTTSNGRRHSERRGTRSSPPLESGATSCASPLSSLPGFVPFQMACRLQRCDVTGGVSVPLTAFRSAVGRSFHTYDECATVNGSWDAFLGRTFLSEALQLVAHRLQGL